MRYLSEYDDVDYETTAELLHKLSGRLIDHLGSYLSEDDVLRTVSANRKPLADLIHVQLREHFYESASGFEAHVVRGFRVLSGGTYAQNVGETIRNFRETIPEGCRKTISGMLFSGFSKSCYSIQKFDSDTERRFTVLLEDDPAVHKWFKPAGGDLDIRYSSMKTYKPDFVVETEESKFLCETKAAGDMEDEDVLAKAEAAKTWCRYASEHAEEHGLKPWTYLLIPHDAVTAQMSLDGLAKRFG